LHLVGADVSAPQRARGDPEDGKYLEDLRDLLFISEVDAISEASTTRGQYSVFQRIWSAKEALTKAVGQGLDFGIDRIEVELDRCTPSSSQPVLEWFRDLLFRSDKPRLEDDASRRTGALLDVEGYRAQEDAPEVAQTSAASRIRTATLFVDMWCRTDFVLAQYSLPDDHWASVVLGPVEEAVDANGEFAATLRLHGVDEILREAKRLKSSQSAAWTRRQPVFQELPVSALVPQGLKQAYLATRSDIDEWG